MTLKTFMRVLDSSTESAWTDAAFRVGFATNDLKTVNQHFGSTPALAVFAVDMERTQLMEVFRFDEAKQNGENADAQKAAMMPNAPSGALDFEGKLAAKIEALDGCIAVYAQAAGSSAVGQLKARGIQPVKVSSGSEIGDLLESLQYELRMGPNAWLANAIRTQTSVDPKRFDDMEAEGWEE